MKETLSHRQLQLLIQVSNVLNSSLQIDTIIDSIMVQTVSVIDAAGGGVLFLYDKENDVLTAKSDSKFKSNILEEVRLKPGESMTGLAFTAKQCLIFSNRTEVERATATLSAKNMRLMMESIPTLPYSTICAPIFLKGECIGVITLDSFDPSQRFIPEDINLLQAITHQAAVALEKASLYREQENAVKQLEHLNNMITEQNLALSRSVEIHNSLADLVLNGEGLPSILGFLHKKIGLQLLLFDEIGELIAASHDSDFPEEDIERARSTAISQLKGSGFSNFPTYEQIHDDRTRLAILPVGTKPRLLGALAIAARDEISTVDISALEHACTVLSLELVKNQAVFDAEERMHGELIDGLSKGQLDESILQKARLFDFDQNGYFMAIIVHLDNVDDFQKRTSILRHLASMANRAFQQNHLKGIVAKRQDQIVVILAFQQKVSTTFASQNVKELVSLLQKEIALKSWGTTVSIGIGRIHSGLMMASKSLQEAAKCIQFIKSNGAKNQIISYRDLGVQRLLLQNSEGDLTDFMEEVLGPLITYDKSKKGELMPTLFAWLEHNQKAKEAAESLHIHTNTLMYRLKRIEEILGVSLSDSSQFLNIHLAISLYPALKRKGKSN